jgi:hypothetical protein
MLQKVKSKASKGTQITCFTVVKSTNTDVMLSSYNAAAGTQFTSFAGTKVQILT